MATPECDQKIPLRSYRKWSPSEHGATLVWRDVCVYTSIAAGGIAQKNGRSGVCQLDDLTSGGSPRLKRIINNSTGAVQPGTLMAIMGSSGSGKTTLMSVLAHRQPTGTTVQGEILVNGRRIGPFMHRISGYVYQEDLFDGTLTVHEHLNFMAHLALDRRVTRLERENLVHGLLERNGLLDVAHTRIGTGKEGENILSGGERKRLAFAVELLNRPVILFCDEPTTGLDSYSAQQLVRILHELSQMGTTVLCTIHQPSSQLFDMFNNVLLLADGRVAYNGPPQKALEFFAQYGYRCPGSYNPADYLIGVLSLDPVSRTSSQRSAHHLCDLFAVSEAGKRRDLLVNLEIHMSEMSDYSTQLDFDDFQMAIWPRRFRVLWQRATLSLWRDPTLQWLRFIQKLAMAFIIGICFLGTTQFTQYGIQSVQGALFLMISENTFHPMYAILNIFPQSFPILRRETRAGLYTISQYYVARIVAMLPGLILEPLVFVCICYWLTGLRQETSAFIVTAISIILVMNVSTACGCFFSATFNSVSLAMAYLVPVDYIFMITSGTFIQIDSLSVVFKWTQYLSWMMYVNEAMSIAQWSEIYNISCWQNTDRDQTLLSDTDDLHTGDLPCLHSGQEVLDKYSFKPTHLYTNLLAMLALLMAFHILACYSLRYRLRRS